MKAKEQIRMMGAKVMVFCELTRNDKPNGLHVWEPKKLDPPKIGWIVGFRHLPNGVHVSGSEGFEGEWEPGYLKETMKRTPAVMVCYWPTHAPVPVSSWAPVPDSTPVKSPYVWEGEGAERIKKELKEIMAKIPRDAKGRWKKE